MTTEAVRSSKTTGRSNSQEDNSIWTNAASHDFLRRHYERNQRLEDKVPAFLDKHGFVDWRPTAYTRDYFPKFMAGAGSWTYSFTHDGKPGPGLLMHRSALQEPSLDIKELAMGYSRGATTVGGLLTSMRHKLLRACLATIPPLGR